MKKTKFTVLFTALMTVLGLSSCLGDPDPYVTQTEIMKVNDYMGFYSFGSAAGYTVEPTNSNLLTEPFDNQYSWVTYKYDTRTLTQGSNKIQAEIQYLLPINEIQYMSGSIESTASMHTVSSSVKFYDKTNVFINLTYYYKDSEDNDVLKEELAKHNFYLYKATAEEDEDVNDNTMVLYLIHTVSDPDQNGERDDVGTETRHFNLNLVLGGSDPDKIIIKFKQNSSSAAVDDKTNDSEMIISYKEIADYYNNYNI